MTNKERTTIIKNVLNSLSDIEIKARYAKIYSDCFDALVAVAKDIEENSEGKENVITN